MPRLRHGQQAQFEGKGVRYDVVEVASERGMFLLLSRAKNGRWPGTGYILVYAPDGSLWTNGTRVELLDDGATVRRIEPAVKFAPDDFVRGQSPFPAFGDPSYRPPDEAPRLSLAPPVVDGPPPPPDCLRGTSLEPGISDDEFTARSRVEAKAGGLPREVTEAADAWHRARKAQKGRG
jgi:hypothetical protein